MMQKIFSIIILITLCLGKINAQTAPVVNLPLSGIRTGNHEYEAVNIQSTQTIRSGRTTYRAGERITLNPGFRVELGAGFRAEIDAGVQNIVNIMTYNISRRKYGAQGRIIRDSGADVVAVQEILRIPFAGNFNRLKNNAEMDGVFLPITGFLEQGYGIALLWRSELGTPTITERIVFTGYPDHDSRRGFIIAEFRDFIVVSTHFPTDNDLRKRMAERILSNSIIQNAAKPVFIAGDLNFEPKNRPSLWAMFEAENFELLNYSGGHWRYGGEWYYHKFGSHYMWVYCEYHWTNNFNRPYPGQMIDLILGRKTDPPSYEVLDRGIPRHAGVSLTLSSHKPYMVRVRLK